MIYTRWSAVILDITIIVFVAYLYTITRETWVFWLLSLMILTGKYEQKE